MAGKPHPWPREGFVAIAGAESPDTYVFLPVNLIEGRKPESGQAILRTSGNERWLSSAE